MNKRFAVMASVASIFVASQAQAALLTFNTAGNLGTETSEPSATNDPGVLPTSISVGSGIAVLANADRLGGNNYFDTGDPSPTTIANAIANAEYFELTVTPAAGYSFTPTSLGFRFERSATGPASLTLRSSADGFTADLGTALPASGVSTNAIPIAGLTNRTTALTFRLYGYGATGTTGSGGFDQPSGATTAPNITLDGTTIPEPAALVAFVAAGLAAVARRRRA